MSFVTYKEVKKLKNAFIIGPGASGKTRLLHKINEIEIAYKAPSIILNKVFDENGNSLKYGKNVFGCSEKQPIIYIAPNYKSLDGYKPNVDEWISAIKKENASAIICYVRPFMHKQRLENRIKYKKNNEIRQHLDNYPFSYQNLFYKLEKNSVKYYIINSEEE